LEQAKAARRGAKDSPEAVQEEVAAKPATPAPEPAPANPTGRDGGWIENALNALRMEIQRLRTDHSDKPPAAKPLDPVVQTEPPPAPSRKSKKAATAKKAPKPKPLQDEWGIYDPSQAGFDALFAKIDEASEGEEEESEEGDDPADQLLAEQASTDHDADDPAAMLLAHPTSAVTQIVALQATPQRVGLAPLAMWAHAATPELAAPNGSGGKDHLRALMAQLQLPSAVASVSYPTGCRIRRVRVAQPQTTKAKKKANSDEPLVILSRKRLRELRESENSAE
jgi:hypothetical protein